MLSNKALVAALEYVRLLCQVPQSPQPNYALALYSELKDIYTDDGIMIAAREICHNEKLYGFFPALTTWLQYCPKIRAERIANATATGTFMEMIDFVMQADPMIFDLDATRKKIWDTYGQRAATAVKEFGGIRGVRSAGYGATKMEQENLRRQIKFAWVTAGLDSTMNAAQIAAQTQMEMIENKKDG